VFSKFEYTIPDYVNGLITIEFRNLDENSYANGILPLVVNRVYLEGQEVFQDNVSIPDWIKTNAGWWAEGIITDDDFVQGIQFLIKNEIMKIPDTNQAQTQSHDEIPSWIKNNAQWWSQGKIDDESFVNGIQFLIENGIMKI